MSTNNSLVLSHLLNVLELDPDVAVNVFGLGGLEVGPDDLPDLLSAESEVPDEVLARFLDGLIVHRRGPRDPSKPPVPVATSLSNNDILKKLRIAFELHEDDMLGVFEAGGLTLDAGGLKDLFRREGHRNHTACDAETLRHFLDGLGSLDTRSDDQTA